MGACSGTRGWSGQNTEGRVGASHWDQNLARLKDTVSDGKTQLRLHERKDNTPILEFGEKILYMPAKPARGGKWERRFHPGVFVGLLNSSSEAVVVTEQGLAVKTRAANVRRIPESEMGRGPNTRNASCRVVSRWQ